MDAEKATGAKVKMDACVGSGRMILAGVAIMEIVMAIALMPWTDHDRIETTDFAHFYVAATLVRHGLGPVLYRPEAQEPLMLSILGRHTGVYFLHPPFFAAALVPLTYFSVERAFVMWTLVNVALLGLWPLLLGKCAGFVVHRPYLGWLGMIFVPVLNTLTLGQDSILLVIILTTGYVLWSREQDLTAGLVLALSTIKFQYLFVVMALLLIQRKFRLIMGFAAGCVALALISLAITGVDGAAQYIHFLQIYNSNAGYGAIHLAQMVNWRGFFAGWE